MSKFLWQRSRSTENAICSICLEDKKNRRRLPCQHSFCLGCLERHCKDRLPGDNVLCPLCRTGFRIPENGLDGLKDPRDDRGVENTCEVCSTPQDIKPATVYCVDCGQLLCERCSLPHRKMPGGSHSLRQLAEPVAPGSLKHCDEHAGEIAGSYCLDCQVNICMKCFIDFHKQHNCQKPDDDACRRAMLQVESESGKFVDSVQKTKRQVKERGEAVKRVVDGHVRDLLERIDAIESDTRKQSNAITDTLKAALSGTGGSDVERFRPARAPSTEELMITCLVASCYIAPDVAFIPSDIDELIGAGGGNTVGAVHKTTSRGK